MVILTISAEPVPLRNDVDGVFRVGKTRVTLDTLIDAYQTGATVEEIAQQYPSLQFADIYTVLGYYLRHQEEVDQYLEERRQQARQVRRQNEQQYLPIGVRERLLVRRR